MVNNIGNVSLEDYQKAYREVRKRHERLGFMVNLSFYLLVNILLITVNLLLAPEFPWAIFPIVFWGLGVIFHYNFGVRRLDRKLNAEEAKAFSSMTS
jgi:uncharacterized membrane protein YhaH (DUF805 family)